MTPLQKGARGLGEVLVSAGVVLLLFVGWQLWWTDATASRAQASTTAHLQQQWDAEPPVAAGPAGGVVSATPKPVRIGTAFAVLRIPRFGKKYVKPIYQGFSEKILNKGVGHYNHTQMPGEVGNFAVAGHRVTYGKPFNLIATLRPGDAIVVETATTWYVYRAVRHVIVTPTHTEVLAPVPLHPGQQPTRAWMTMTACHPEFSARQRYVEFAVLDQTLPKSSGHVPAALAGYHLTG
jgi:sortase A